MLTQLVANGILAGTVYAFVGIGLSIVYRTSRAFPIVQAALFLVAPYIALLWRDSTGGGVVVACVIGVAASVLLAVGLELGVDSRLRRVGASWEVQLLASLGQFIVLQNALSLCFGDDTRSLRGSAVSDTLSFGGASLTAIQLSIAIMSVLLIGCVTAWLRWTRLGKTMRAVADAPDLADVYGVQRGSVIVIAVSVGAAIAGSAGCFIGLDLNVNPTLGLRLFLMGLTAAVLGGVTSTTGILLGGLLLGVAENLGVAWLRTEWQQAVAYTIMLGFLLIRPHGFLGRPAVGERV